MGLVVGENHKEIDSNVESCLMESLFKQLPGYSAVDKMNSSENTLILALV